jgi:hypothetical protein
MPETETGDAAIVTWKVAPDSVFMVAMHAHPFENHADITINGLEISMTIEQLSEFSEVLRQLDFIVQNEKDRNCVITSNRDQWEKRDKLVGNGERRLDDNTPREIGVWT